MHGPICSVRSRRIGLVVDHPLRDLDGLCLVAQLLAARGHEVVLLPFYTQHFDLPNVALDIIVLNYARPANEALVRAAMARRIALAVLDTEGGLLPERGPTSPAGIAEYLNRSGLDRELALYMFWGEHLRNAIVKGTALPPERAIVTGCPRIDLARKKATERANRVLVNTNFPIVNSAHTDGERIDSGALRSVGFSDREIANLAGTVDKVMRRMIEAVRSLAQARPAKNFVIRPHPFERSVPYERAFASLPNVTIERVGTAMEAIGKSACLLHVNCTTAIEACLSGIPPISLDFVNEPALQTMARLPTDISHKASSLAETLELIDRADLLSPGVEHHRITPYFGPLDGQAAMRVADALSTVPLDSCKSGTNQPVLRRHLLSTALGRLAGSKIIEGARSLMDPSRRMKRFGPADVRRCMAKFAAAHGQHAAVVKSSRSALGIPTLALEIKVPPQ